MWGIETQLETELLILLDTGTTRVVNAHRISHALSARERVFLSERIEEQVLAKTGVGEHARMVTLFSTYSFGFVAVPKEVTEDDPRLDCRSAHSEVYLELKKAMGRFIENSSLDHYMKSARRSLRAIQRSKAWPDLLEVYRCILHARLLMNLENL